MELTNHLAYLEYVLKQVLAGPHATADLDVDVAVEGEEKPGVIIDDVSIIGENVPLNE